MNNPLYLYVFNQGANGQFLCIMAISMLWMGFWVWRSIKKDNRLTALLNLAVGLWGAMFGIVCPLLVYLNDPMIANKIELVNYPRMIPAYTCQTYTLGSNGFE